MPWYFNLKRLALFPNTFIQEVSLFFFIFTSYLNVLKCYYYTLKHLLTVDFMVNILVTIFQIQKKII